MPGFAVSRSIAARNAVNVLPDPVGAWIRTCSPLAIAGQPSVCGGVGPANVRSNQARVAGEKTLSGSTRPGYSRATRRGRRRSRRAPARRRRSPRRRASHPRGRSQECAGCGRARPLRRDPSRVRSWRSATPQQAPRKRTARRSRVGGMEEPITRRGSLAKLGGLLATAAGGSSLLAGTAEGGNRAIETGAAQCVLTPELTEGPYYIAGEKLRRDVRDGHPGALLTLRLTILNASTCKPIKNAAVDIWHADAAGNYSGFGAGASSRTFMRGIQKTDASGVAHFTTVYPGWYQGRAVHIHVKVHVGGAVVHTGQLFFNDSLTDRVYKRRPYSARGSRDTRNARDSIYRNGGKKGVLSMRKHGSGYVGSIAMGVSRS